MDPPTPSNSHFDYLGVAWCDRCGRRQEMHWHESTQEQVCGGCGRAVVPKNGRLTTAEQAALRARRAAYVAASGVNLDVRRDTGPADP